MMSILVNIGGISLCVPQNTGQHPMRDYTIYGIIFTLIEVPMVATELYLRDK